MRFFPGKDNTRDEMDYVIAALIEITAKRKGQHIFMAAIFAFMRVKPLCKSPAEDKAARNHTVAKRQPGQARLRRYII